MNSKLWPIAASLLVIGLLGSWYLFARSTVLAYGEPAKTYFKPAQAAEGDEIELCFDGITWYRLCQGRLVTHLTPRVGSRLDLASYIISTPPTAGPIGSKCRKWTVPSLGLSRQGGPAILSGHATFDCGWHSPTLTVMLPQITIDITKK